MSNITKLFLPIVHTLKRTDYDHFWFRSWWYR